MGKLYDDLVNGGCLVGSGDCPCCGSSLHMDTGSIVAYEDGLIPEIIYFCTTCGFDSEKDSATPR